MSYPQYTFLRFDATASTPGAGNDGPYTFTWTMPDNSIQTGPTAEMDFNTPGSFTVQVSVFNAATGRTTTESVSVSIMGGA